MSGEGRAEDVPGLIASDEVGAVSTSKGFLVVVPRRW